MSGSSVECDTIVDTGRDSRSHDRPVAANPRAIHKTWITAAIAVALFIATAAVFGRVLGAEFVRWDDNVTIFENRNLGNLSLHRLAWAFTDVETTMRYVPLSLLSWSVTHQFFGLDPLGYHLGNLLLHAMSVAMAFLVFARLLSGNVAARRTSVTLIAATLGALLWGLHPLRVEPVAWCTGRTYDLATFFALITLWSYLKFAVHDPHTDSPLRRRLWYWTSVAAYLACLLSHPVGIGLVAALLIIDVYPLQRARFAGGWPVASTRRCLWQKAPFLAVSALVIGLSLLARFHKSELYSGQGVSLAEFGVHKRILQAFYLWAYYAWRPWWPVDLTPMRTELMHFQSTDARFTISMAMVLLVTMAMFRMARKFPIALALWLYHLVILVPVLGWTEHPHYPSDRYALLAGLTWPLAIAAGLCWVGAHRRKLFALAAGATAVMMIALATLTTQQTGVWKNSQALFDHMLKVLGNDPQRADILARVGLLHAYANPPDYDRAAASFQQGLDANPRDFRIRLLLADVWTRQHKQNSAVLLLSDGLAIDPNNMDLRLFLAWTLHRGRRDPEALIEFERLSRLYPEHPDIKKGLEETRRSLSSSR